MFEKAAKEHAEKILKGLHVMNGREWAIHDVTFKDGAEFGYNKANEWHYVKDGLPETSGRYLVYTGGEPFTLYFSTEVNSFGYWVVSLGDDWGVRDEDFETVKDREEDEVIAWKEIVLPKLKEGGN